MRTAARTDENQALIIKTLRAIGCSVYVIKEPVDLMCGYKGRTVALEVKNPKGDWKLTKQQREFFAEFQGEAYIVENEEQALKAIRGSNAR